MEVRQVDFRDAAEDEFSSVPGLLLVEARPRPGGSPVEKLGFHATEYEISDARSVYEVLAWAEAHSGPERTYCVCVVPPGNLDPDTKWMDRLAGVDPTNHSTYGTQPDGYSWDSIYREDGRQEHFGADA